MRTQTDGKQDQYSKASGLDCSEDTDTARQEFKDEADTNKLLARFGVGVPQKQISYGSADFDMDLQQAYAAVEELKYAWNLMPNEIRTKYKDWQTLIVALDSGEVKFDPTQPAGSRIVLPNGPTPDPKTEVKPATTPT